MGRPRKSAASTSDMSQEQILNALVELGLSRNESHIYLKLLSLGPTSAGPLIEKTKLHRQVVYQGLDRLIDFGIVTKLSKNNRFIFSASNPAELEKIFERQLQKASSLVPLLHELQGTQHQEVEVKVLYGKQGLYENLIESINSAKRGDGSIRIITGKHTSQFWEVLGSDSERYLKLSERSKVRKKLIAHPSYPGWPKQRIFTLPGNEIRFQSDLPTLPSSTRITAEYVAIEVYEPQIFVIQILSPLVARAYIDYFEIMWRSATKSNAAVKQIVES